MFTSEEIIKATGANIKCHPSPRHNEGKGSSLLVFSSVCQSSSTIEMNEIFIAIQGERFDGHSFLKEVFDKGVMAAIVQEGKADPKKFPGKTFFEVKDTLKALGDVASFHRKKFSIPLIGITGSNGKTTTKELIAKILEQKFSVLKTEGNLNNLIGLPFMLLRLNAPHQMAVLEMGMSFPFEIKRLCEIAMPTSGLITNIGRAHLASMKSPQKIAKAKGALFESLSGKNVAFINMDDPFLKPFAKKLRCQVRTYSFLNPKADVYGKIRKDLGLKGVELNCQWKSPKRTSINFHLPLPGSHNALNALAAIAVGSYYEVEPADIKKAIESFIPTESRSHIIHLKDVVVIDDSYNANPDSMVAALKMLKKIASKKTTYVVLADMLELGAKEKQYHTKIGKIIKESGFDYVLTFGRLSQYIIKSVAQNKRIKTYWTLKQDDLIHKLKQELKFNPGVVLVKGSHGMKMDRVVLALIEFFRQGK